MVVIMIGRTARARLDDSFARRLVPGALRLEREVDHHDRVLLHQPHQHDDAHEA